MVGMDAQLVYENSKENGVCGESFGPRAQANGDDVIYHLEDSGTPPASASGEINNKGSALCPITPVLNRECSRPESKRNEEVVASAIGGSPRTPDGAVFDPFAPGPDEMCLAPICKKLLKQSQKIVVRRLDFEEIDDSPPDNSNVDALSEKMLLESVYGTLLEAIILKQAEEFYAENQVLEMEVVHTPTSQPPLTGVAETCPGAPMKVVASRSRNIDRGLCRKLDF